MSATQVQATDSIESQDPRAEDHKKTKSRRPANTAFRQQRLKAWQPILTPKTVLPLFFAIGVIFAPIGGLLIWASSQVQELSIDYSECAGANGKAPNITFPIDPSQASNLTDIPSGKWTSYFNNEDGTTSVPRWGKAEYVYNYSSSVQVNTAVCVLEFRIPNDLKPPVLLYYRLTNFYQNHRRYVKSLDENQLLGDARSASQIESGDCDPLDVDPETNKPYYPCGLIANSLFNDTFETPLALSLPGSSSSDPVPYEMTNKSIAWDSDKDLYKKTKYSADDVVPPPNWRKRYPNGYTDERGLPDLHNDEAFQVWMRTAGLPTFSKLALRNDDDTMKVGDYRLVIWDNFPVLDYGGTKSILITTRTVMGGKNPYLGIAYVVVGGICIVLGAIFTATHLIKPRKLGDHTYLSWNNDQPATATATGRSIRPGDA